MRPNARSRPRSIWESILDLDREHGPRLDWGILLALALGLFAAIPFLSRQGLPHQTDAELHVYRAAEIGHAISEGVLYPRWAPNLYLGYGYPIFNYYAPLTYYLANLFAVALPGVDVVGGVKAVFVVGLLLASGGAYLLGRDLFDAEAGVLAAASFTLSPYVLFIDPHARGDLAEHFAVCLIPLALYFFRRMMSSPTRWKLLGSILSLGAVVFSHNLTGLIIMGLLLGYWVWQVVVEGRRQHAVWGPIAFTLAASLIAFFWLPAWLESDAVKLEVIGPGHFDFREHFLSLGELLAPSRLIDWGATGPRYRHNLGLAQWLLAVPAVVVVARLLSGLERNEKGRGLLFFSAAAMALIFLTLPMSNMIWESVPLMAYMQFPWRLLGPANLMLAMCTAGSVAVLPHGPWRRPIIAAIFALVVVTALPLLYPPPWPSDFGGTSPIDTIRWERETRALGTTSTGDFLPATVEMIPKPVESLVESYASDGPVDKVNRATLPESTAVTIVEHGPDRDHFYVETPEAFVLRLYTFYFPGWKAYVDGENVDIELARPEGFITVRVPAGKHDVLVRHEDTPPRKAGTAISAAALVILTVIMLVWRRQEDGHEKARRLPCASGTWLWLAGTLALVVCIKLAALDPLGCLYQDSPPGQALPAQHQVHADFGGKIELLGYDLGQTRLRPGDTLSVVLYWRAIRDVAENYQSFVHVAEPLDVAWAQGDHLNPGGLPTSRWPRDKYVWDEYKIRIPAEMPSGVYRLNVGLYRRSEGDRLRRRDGGQDRADSVVISSIEVTQ